MAMVGNNATVINQTGKYADMRPFCEDLFRMESVPIVDEDLYIACEEHVVCAFDTTQLDSYTPHEGGGANSEQHPANSYETK